MSRATCRFSIIVPTHQRRQLLLRSVESIVAAERPWPCELIVVVDGSTDGTCEALAGLQSAGLQSPIPLIVIRQDNLGAARARNRGAAAASGEYLLFLDDDMSIDPRLLIEHDKTLAAGADAVVGDIPLHPDSPSTLLARGVARWSEQRRRRLVREQGQLTISDFLTGQLSVRAGAFAGIGGFDEALTAGGSFGGEDTDFIFRLMKTAARVKYNGAAVSYQSYVVEPGQNMRQWWQAGRADAMLSRKHAAIGAILWRQHRGATLLGLLAYLMAGMNPRLLRTLQSWIVRRATAGHTDRLTEWAFARIRDVAYWAGARAGGGIVRKHHSTARVLAYHAVDRVDDPLVGRYCVDPASFEEQITALVANGFTFIDVDRLIAHLDGGEPLADRSILLTFDDGYESLISNAAPLLAKLGIPAVVCVVTSQLGGHNAWDEAQGAARLPLLDVAQLHTLSGAGWEIASHSDSHAHLTSLPVAQLVDELCVSRARLAAAGLPSPRLIAYPHGEHDLRVRRFARQAGYSAGLALRGRRGFLSAAERYALPRIEVLAGMGAGELLRLLDHPQPARPGLRRGLGALVRTVLDAGHRTGDGSDRLQRRAGALSGDIDRGAIR